MTIASEITRLNNAKSDIKTAIENKGVTVPSTDKIDCYASCIDAIEQGGGGKSIDFILVGGGGAGGNMVGGFGGGGGGGGGVIRVCGINIKSPIGEIVDIGAGGCGEVIGNNYVARSHYRGQGLDSCFLGYTAKGGGAGSVGDRPGSEGGSGGGTSTRITPEGCMQPGARGTPGQGFDGGVTHCYETNAYHKGAGGGGAGTSGVPGYVGTCEDHYCAGPNLCSAGTGGCGLYETTPGLDGYYGAGGGGGGDYRTGHLLGGCGGYRGGGAGGAGCCNGIPCKGCDATGYGAGGGGAGGTSTCYQCAIAGGNGKGGFAFIKYKTDGSCGVCDLCGGCIVTCNGYKYHIFTSTGVLYENNQCKKVKFLLVGGGAGSGGYDCNCFRCMRGAGGGGAVINGFCGDLGTSTCVIVGCRGYPGYYCCAPGGGGLSRFGSCTALGGCIGKAYNGGQSGNGNSGGVGCYCAHGGGGGAGCRGENAQNCCNGGSGGIGRCGYGGGGAGFGAYVRGFAFDGGGQGYSCCYCSNTDVHATNCGGGAGSPRCCYSGCGGYGGCGLVEVCYPKDGSWGITSATGGTKSEVTEGGITYCKHRFTSNGTFTIVN